MRRSPTTRRSPSPPWPGRDGKPHPALLRALQDKTPTTPRTIAEVLVQGGGPEGRAAARKLLTDDSAEVRLRVALTVAKARDRDGVPVLIDLLTILPLDQAAQVEDSLHQLAGDSAPDVTVGAEAAERKKCRDAWAGWWKVNASRVDLTRLTARPWFGFTLIVDLQGNRVFELDRKSNQRWIITNAGGPTDARILPGNRVLIAEYGADRITERDFSGKILWEKRIPNPVNVQRLANGNTFVSTFNGPIYEFDRSGTEVSHIDNPAGQNQAANRTQRGTIVALAGNGQCCIMDATGRQIKQFAAGNMQNCLGGIDVTTNGRIIVAQQQAQQAGGVRRRRQANRGSGCPEHHVGDRAAQRTFSGGRANAQRVFEVDRTGKVVWEFAGAGQVARARRR